VADEDRDVRFTAEELGTQPGETDSELPPDIQEMIDKARLVSDMDYRTVARTEHGDYVLSTVLRPEAILSGPAPEEYVPAPYESALIHAGGQVRIWAYRNLADAEQGHVTLVRTLHAGPPYDWDNL
jgi:hypothetical protein